MKSLIVGVTVSAMVLAGCSSTDDESVVQASIPSDAASSTASPSPSEDPSTDWDAVRAFLRTDARTGYTGLVLPGSPAERWVEFTTDLYQSELTDGSYYPDDSSWVVDTDNGTASRTAWDGVTTVLSDWVTDGGMVVSYSDSSGTPIGSRLWTEEPTAELYGTTVTLRSAFRNSSGAMVINVSVSGGDMEFIDFNATYVGPDGVARQPSNIAGSQERISGATNLVTYIYDQVGFGGSFHYEVFHPNGWDTGDIILVVK